MSRVKRKITIKTATSLRAMIGGNKGKGTTSLHGVKLVRKAIEKMVMEDGTALTHTDHNKTVHICADQDNPLYRCPECEEGYLVKDKAGEWQKCTKAECEFHGRDYDEDEDDIVGYKPLKINGKRPRTGIIELPKRLVIDTIWKKILQPLLVETHNVNDEDMIESICDDFEIDCLPDRFITETTVKEEPEPEKKEEKIIEENPTEVEMPKADGPASLLKEDEAVSTR